jgi:ribosome-binding protein aMBF1 (putative translation factor)
MRTRTAMAQARRDRGLTQWELASQVGCDQSRLSAYEGTRQYLLPTSSIATTLAQILEIPARALQDPVPERGSPTQEEMRRTLGADVADRLMEAYGGRRLPMLPKGEARRP